jgi:hypothetical protein
MVEDLSKILLNLFFIPGSTYYVADPKYRHVKESITLVDIEKHISGELSIAAPSTYEKLVKWIAVDIDILDHNLIRKAVGLLRENELPAYASFSGNKGYHIYIFLENAVPLAEAQDVSGRIQSLFKTAAIPYDKISPSPTGNGGDCMCLPLGTHPVSGEHRYLLDDDMTPIMENPIEFLSGVKKFRLKGGVNPDTGLIESITLPEKISQKECINILWRDGIKAPGTRHYAICTIANAIIRSPIPPDKKEDALLAWIARTFDKADKEHLTTSELPYWIEEAKRIFKVYLQHNYAETCDNPIFRAAMISVCPDEFKCKLTQNRGICDYRMLKRLKVWNAPNAKPRGLGKSAQSIYEALHDIAENNKIDEVDGVPTFSTTQQEIALLSNCTSKTVRKHLGRLKEVGLVTEPQSPPSKRYSYYGLPITTESLLISILGGVRGYG